MRCRPPRGASTRLEPPSPSPGSGSVCFSSFLLSADCDSAAATSEASLSGDERDASQRDLSLSVYDDYSRCRSATKETTRVLLLLSGSFRRAGVDVHSRV